MIQDDKHLQILQEDAQEGYERFVELHRGLLERAKEILKYAMRQYPGEKYLESVDFEKGVINIHYLTITRGVSVQFPKFPSVQRKMIQLPADLLYSDDWQKQYDALAARRERKSDLEVKAS